MTGQPGVPRLLNVDRPGKIGIFWKTAYETSKLRLGLAIFR